MGAVMARCRKAWCLAWVALAWGAVAPSSAQLLDPLPQDTTGSAADQAPPPATEEPSTMPRPSVPPKRVRPEGQGGQIPIGILRPAGSEKPAAPEAPKPAPSKRDSQPLLILFLTLLGVGLVLFAVERVRAWITTNVPVQRILGALALLLRVAGLGVVLAIVLELIPGAQDWILWTLLVLVLVIGWSVRDLFADLVAGLVLAAERRVKKGVWVSGEGFQGTVEGRSLRATWLRDGQGHRLTVPNRSMVGAPMVYDAGADAEHEVVVRLEGYEDAGRVRLALTDAILSSPWVLAGATPVVLRDPADPVVWRVRTKLLEPRFSVHFEGELLERVEDLLRYQPPVQERETVPGEVADDS